MLDNNMNGSWFFDENFNGVPDDFFDDALKYLDLPHEDLEPNDDEDWAAKFQHLDPPPSSVLTSLSSGFGSGFGNDASKVKECSSVSRQSSAEASLSRTSLCDDSLERKHSQPFQTSSPISVLDSSSSSSSCCAENLTSNCAKSSIPMTRPRSKRSRSRRSGISFVFTCYTPKTLYPLAASESESELCLDEKVLNPAKKREKRKNLMLLSSSVAFEKQFFKEAVETRKCSHCEVTKTPQWREGPMGPKTLCNACGVRYRSGRLLPEYRPAASPTFSPLLHSNSHRKVLEMRNRTVFGTRRKSAQVIPAATMVTSSTAREELFF